MTRLWHVTVKRKQLINLSPSYTTFLSRISACFDDNASTFHNIKWKRKLLSCVRLFVTPWTIYSPLNSPGQNPGVGSLSLLQGIFPTQELNPGLLYCRRILYQLRHKGSPRILGWVAFPFSRGSSRPGIKPGSPALQVDSLPAELPGKCW